MLASQLLGQRLEPFDTLGNPVERLTPKQLHVSLFGRNFFRGGRCTAEVQLRMTAFVNAEGARLQRRVFDGEVLAVVGDVLFAPEPTDQLQEFASPLVPARLVEIDVAVGAHIVGTGNHVDQQPAVAELIEGGGGAGEKRGMPVAGADRDQRRERGGSCRDRRRDRERVSPPPPGADQRTAPAVLLGALRELGRILQAAPTVDGVVAPMPGQHSIRDVPKIFAAHRTR